MLYLRISLLGYKLINANLGDAMAVGLWPVRLMAGGHRNETLYLKLLITYNNLAYVSISLVSAKL
jgi:hypothetical protein